MALEKITEAQMNAAGVVAAPDILNGTAAENKAIFDRMVRNLVAPAYNACVDVVNELENVGTGLKTSENERKTAEADRVAAEVKRTEAEAERETAEKTRTEAEAERKTAENIRQDLEIGYVAQAKNAAEDARYWAEKAQQSTIGGDMQSDVYDPQGKKQDIFKYVEDKVAEGGSGTKVYAAIIGTSWAENEDTGVKTQIVSIDGITAANTAKVDHAYTGNGTSEAYAAFVEEENQYLEFITNGFAETVAGGIKFTIFGDAPTVAIPIVVEVV